MFINALSSALWKIKTIKACTIYLSTCIIIHVSIRYVRVFVSVRVAFKGFGIGYKRLFH